MNEAQEYLQEIISKRGSKTMVEPQLTNIDEYIHLVEKADKIMEIINKYGFYIDLGKEEEFVNDKFNKSDEFTRKRLIKALQEANPIIHHEFGLI